MKIEQGSALRVYVAVKRGGNEVEIQVSGAGCSMRKRKAGDNVAGFKSR